MSCDFEKKEGVRTVVLTFKRDQLLYDIKNCAYAEGHVLSEAAEHNRHMVIDIGETGNVDRVTRVLDLEIAKVREMLYPYAKREIDKSALDNTFKERKIYGIIIKVPEQFSQTTLTLLERLIHEYLVCRAVQDWLSITNTGKAEVWNTKASEAESRLKAALTSRMTRMRIKPHWF